MKTVSESTYKLARKKGCPECKYLYEVMDWLREEHQIVVCIDVPIKGHKCTYTGYIQGEDVMFGDDYYKVLEFCIVSALNELD